MRRQSLYRVCIILAAGTGLLGVPRALQAVGEPPIMDGMILWLDATDPATLFQDDGLSIPAQFGDPVGGWLDKSGNEYHATQPFDEKRPEYDEASMNGMPAVSFNGFEADGMLISDDLFLDRPYSVFIVNQYDGDTRGRTLQSRDNNWLHGLWGGNPASYAEGWVSINRPAEPNFVYVEDTTGGPSGDSSFFLNGIDRTISSTPSAGPGRLGLVSEGSFPAEVSDADVSEILIYDRVLDTAELSAVRDYLYTKYDAMILPDEDPLAPQNIVLSGEIGIFTGGDPGEGLDFEGAFVHAVDVGGFGGVVVGEVEFTDGSIAGIAAGDSPGVSITVANEIPNWHAPEYGDSANDDELELVMQSIRWNVPPGVDVDLEVESGQYQLQLLFAENCCDRGFDITIEGEMAVDNFNVQVTQEGIANTTQGVYFRDTVTVTDGVLNIQLGGVNPRAPDNNPILSAVTLELIGPGAEPGDFNGDGVLDAADIDALTNEVRSDMNNPLFDLNKDGLVDDDDRYVWVEELKNTYMGDANLDGVFDSTDFVAVFQIGEYEDEIVDNSTWAEGDWSGDGDFDSSDFVIAFQSGGFELGPRGAVASVPEPTAAVLGLMGCLGLLAAGRRW